MNMKRLLKLLMALTVLSAFAIGFVQAESASSAMQRIGQEVAALNLGFGDYVLGRTLSAQQQRFARNNSIAKTVAGTIKFQDGDISVIAQNDNFMVLGIYTYYPGAKRQQIKNTVGDLMLRFNEPTTMAHDKLIYWAYSKEGLISQDEFDLVKNAGDTGIIATVKFSSASSILPAAASHTAPQESDEEESTSDIYVMITSNPLSKIFLAEHH